MENTETVELSDGRKVTMRELNGLDMMVASRLVAAKGSAGGDSTAMAATATVLAIESIDGQKFERPSNLVQVQTFMKTVKMKDFGRLSVAFARLNGDEEPGEVIAVE